MRIVDITKMVEVIDGNTFDVAFQKVASSLRVVMDEKIRRVHLADVDAPGNDEKGGDVAADKLRELLTNQQLRIEPQDTDKYGRTVAQVYIGDVDVNDAMRKFLKEQKS